MSTAPVATRHALTILSGPERAGSEQRWRVCLDDGRLAVLARLLPELAADPAIRRRYVHDLDRLLTLADAGLAPILEVGPTPDPRDPAAAPPWRLRGDPPGETLAAWLARRAPAPIDEVSAIGAALADRLAEIHDRGVILRDLAPSTIVLGDDYRIMFTDVGLARVDSARGLLIHQMRLAARPAGEPAFIADYRIVAPTEWNFHPDGAFMREARAAAHCGTASLRHRLRALALALDPCVAVRWTIEETQHA